MKKDNLFLKFSDLYHLEFKSNGAIIYAMRPFHDMVSPIPNLAYYNLFLEKAQFFFSGFIIWNSQVVEP